MTTERDGVPASEALALRQLRIPASALGISEARVIEQLRAERHPQRLVFLARKLAVIGGERSIEPLSDLAADRRYPVAKAGLLALGQIGSASAVEFLLGFEEGGIPRLRDASITALGKTGSDSGLDRLIEIATDVSDNLRNTAINALATRGGDEAVATLAAISEGADYYTRRTAIRALGTMSSGAARDQLLALTKSPDARIRSLALDNISDVGTDKDTRESLMQLLATGNAETAASAATALARADATEALPLLRQLATSGPSAARDAAIEAIAELGGPHVHAVLGGFLAEGDLSIATAAANALAGLGDSESREILLAAVRANGNARSPAVYALRDLRGGDIEGAMLDVGRSGTSNDKRYALQYLLDVGSDAGFDLIVTTAKNGGGYEARYAVGLLSEASSADADRVLAELARTGSPEVRIAALEAIAASGADGEINTMLTDMLAAGSTSDKRSAASMLATTGTPEARDALLAAVRGSDRGSAAAALDEILKVDSGAEVREALVELARKGGELGTAAIAEMVEAGIDDGVTLARETFAGDDETAASAVARALSTTESASARKLLYEVAESANPIARTAVAEQLTGIGDAETAKALLKLAGDEEKSVRHAAYNSLGQTGSKDAIDLLTEVIDESEGAERLAAISALGYADGDRVHGVLADIIEGDETDEMVGAAISEARGGGAVLDRALISVLEDVERSDEVRTQAARRLVNSGADLTSAQRAIVDALDG